MDYQAISLQVIAFFSQYIAIILSILLIVVLAIVAIRMVTVFQRRFEHKIIAQRVDSGQQARLTTLERAGASVINVFIIVLAILMILLALNIDITPILASAGIAGLAISLGAQTIIKDYIGGILILFENQFNVGDDIQVEGVIGTVERIELRATYVRDIQGRLHIIPNGEVRILANYSRDWSRVLVDLNIAFDADIDQAIKALQSAIAQASNDETLKANLLEPPTIQGWNSMNDWAVQVRLAAKTLPGKQGNTAAILRKYALQSLQNANIPLATPPLATRQ
jgi:moderate conductance mechanosensitive channel